MRSLAERLRLRSAVKGPRPKRQRSFRIGSAAALGTMDEMTAHMKGGAKD